ncbi:acetyl-CoA carboxylase, carboxyl transferase, beta subunit [Parvibaculum lavamentivorans DS-1]|uniref:Acetyl-coenzyme A carboxylase carboxyl transferase subunit beta n=1 Tax=Parvibaculum lavamentivorans (strain DS-1 / DSM 13023 / NCIMB 13966) TaxID=402881 RepID=A7HPD1_PARL1|nr:acetyl-CoA carboxylase, carboxyltransferase subunit beta [Parvibaculum lavamentivorans]ABS61764.1 acetyl-CoA carboxylase, carboxyl transferase, beta subunit [Parvibaculum lavamentivorans DS-1]
MNWINNVVRPKIQRVFTKKSTTPDNLWHKCPSCGEMIFHRDLDAAMRVCPNCDHHMRLGTKERFASLFDNDEYQTISIDAVALDPLKFRDQKKYPDRLKEARAKTGREDAVTVAHGPLDGVETVIAVEDFSFMGGSLGMAAGEAIIRGAETALEKKLPYILLTAAGGARMQEGILSLMQMPRTTVALQLLREAGLPFIVVLTDPTTGGVLASYAMLGDVHIAEPKALIGFSGRRVIEQTIREKLPEDFQSAEFQFDHGMVDMIVHRHKLKDTLARLIRLMTHRPRSARQQNANVPMAVATQRAP